MEEEQNEQVAEKQASNNPLAEVEEAIADSIRRCAEISGILKTETIDVFCVSAESSEQIITRRIKGELGLCIFVCVNTVRDVQPNDRASAIAEIEITVRAPDIMSEPYITSSDVAMAIIRDIHLWSFSEPFYENSSVLFTGMTSSNYSDADNNGAVLRELKFEAKINLI